MLTHHYDPRSKILGLSKTYIFHPKLQLASKIAPWLFVAGLTLQLQSLAWVGGIIRMDQQIAGVHNTLSATLDLLGLPFRPRELAVQCRSHRLSGASQCR
jgi:Zn-dependent membrane protease YugP